MPHLTLILLAAGNSSRFAKDTKKQWIRVGADPLWLFVAKRFMDIYKFKEIVVVANPKEIPYMRHYADFKFASGGSSRQESMKNGLELIDSDFVMVSDIARSCIDSDTVLRLIENREKADVIVPYLDVIDTVVFEDTTINRDLVKLIQTPQLSRREVLKKALRQNKEFTDDSSAIKSIGGSTFYIKGSKNAKKITHYDDLKLLECLRRPSKDTFIGQGFDVHAFCDDKTMVLAGVKIDSNLGFKAHSDGDVAIHALIDALLGAIGHGDIGELYPDNDEKYKDMDSKEMLKDVVNFINIVGYQIVNVDLTIMAEYPKISVYKDSMRRVIAKILAIDPIFCNIKATTTEKLGFIGRKEGVAVSAVCSLKFFDWGSGKE